MSRTVVRSIAVAGVAALSLALPVAANAKATAHASAHSSQSKHTSHSKKPAAKPKPVTITGVVVAVPVVSSSSTVDATASTEAVGGRLQVKVKGGLRALHNVTVAVTTSPSTVIRCGVGCDPAAALPAGTHVSIRGTWDGSTDHGTLAALRINAALPRPTATPTLSQSAEPVESEPVQSEPAPSESSAS
ncbi:MAG: hypothetical protein ACTHK1_09670 [Actinomycetales bacterium]